MALSFWHRLFGWSGVSRPQSRRFGNYHIIKIIHEGEKATVYQARSSTNEGIYAIKTYKPQYNRTAQRLAKRYKLFSEGEIGLLLSPTAEDDLDRYPIIKTFIWGREFNNKSGAQFIVQEFVEGFNLKHLIACDHPLVQPRRLDIARTVAEGLAVIHEHGMIHRDVCTDNILLRKDGRVKLIDLGFAVPPGLSFKEKSGTPSYMSPEQFQGKPLYAASDIYSYGVVLFELFTGRLPFMTAFRSDDADHIMRRTADLMQKHLREAPPKPSNLAAELPEGMEAIILRCLEKTPEKRYPNMHLLLGELEQIRERNAPPDVASVHNGNGSN